MRRKEREVTDIGEILRVMQKCIVCRLALSQNGQPYVVPLNFGWEYDSGKLRLYFHCAKEGKKLDILRENPLASFEMDCSHRLVEAEQACNYSFEYESIIGSGRVVIVEDEDEKAEALTRLMKQVSPDREFSFNRAQASSVVVLRLDAEEFACKRLML